jgi:hypothetical protein
LDFDEPTTDRAETGRDSRRELFKRQAEAKAPSILFEFFDFLIHNKKWWLSPIILVLLSLSILIALTSTSVGPFIYALF